MKTDFKLPKFWQLAEEKITAAGPKDKVITIKIAIPAAKLMVESEKGKSWNVPSVATK